MILVFNIGSASFRWAAFDTDLKREAGETLEYPNFSKLEEITRTVLERLSSKQKAPSVIGHRIVHGGIVFQGPTELTSETLNQLQKLESLAPLHIPPALKTIEICQQIFPQIKNVGVFDTAFFSELPDYAKYYAIPLELTRQHQIQRFGFHGISHEYTAQAAAEKIGKPVEDLKLITCHLGSGASLAAIEDGRPIDTSMGFTPLEGVMMATRSGDLDPAIPIFLAEQARLPVAEIAALLNRRSGLLGVSGQSADVRDLIKITDSKSKASSEQRYRAGLALQMYAYRIKKYIGAYAVALGGLDALVFSGAVGEGSELVRNMITYGLEKVLGRFKTIVIPAEEELAIARKIQELPHP